ncbi:MAG: DUF948 domain-containing protein [Desulfobulbales bacterium]|nr:DUF948 domain-containing protein [Desulfobulbales bacterium]
MAITMSSTDLLMIIAAISIVVLMFFLVPLLIQLKQTARRAEIIMEEFDRDIPAILSSARTSAAEIQKLSESIGLKVTEIDEIFQKVKDATGSFLMTGKLVKTTLAPTIIEIAALCSGIKAFLYVIQKTKSTKTEEAPENE